MQTSINLLKQFGNITESSEKIVELIKTQIGAVENSHCLEDDYKNIIVAEITKKENHPDSEKLGIYQINFGSNETIQVVAGDRSLNVGDKVAYLKPGATVPYSINSQAEPFIIKEIKLRGVMSNGMLASERELNISNKHEHVFKLPADAPVGVSFSEYFELNDTVVDVENKALTNRGDLFSIIGLSRELTAITGNKFESPDWYKGPNKDIKPEVELLPLNITNDAEATCPRYTAIVLDNVEIKESPVWLKSALVKSNIKPINNIVDITNYIATLVGQPLHAFDYDKLIKNDPNSKNKANINIRMARDGESLLCLDDKVHNLDGSVMVIADSTHPLAIAGIIGGKEIEIDNETKRIIIESANFDKTNIRRSSMKLGIFTDAATRYKHALDVNHCMVGLTKAVELSKELADAKVASNIIDILTIAEESRSISLDIDIANRHLGTDLDLKTIEEILSNLEYTILESNKNLIKVGIPSWRKDVIIKEDIHEDIGRVYGFNNIKLELPTKKIQPRRENALFDTKKKIRDLLTALGGNETLNYNFTNSNTLTLCNLSSDLTFKVRNPLAPELSLMRTSLLPSLIQKSKENLQRGFDSFLLYEMNIAHIKGYVDENNLPKENWYVSGVLVNKKGNTGSPYFGAKKYTEKLFSSLNIRNEKYVLIADSTEQDIPEFVKNGINMFDPNTSAIIYSQNICLGIVGQLREDIKANFKLPVYSCAFELNIQGLIEVEKQSIKHKETPVYPIFTQDVCFEIEKEVLFEDIKNEIDQVVNTDTLWGRIECLDIYSNEKLESKKRITFRITASSYNKTLNEKDIKAITDKIAERVDKKFSGKLI